MNKRIMFIGDVHGRIDLLQKILSAHPSEFYFYVFCGDLNDYGDEYADISSSLGCIAIVRKLIEDGLAECVQSNHQDKLRRYLAGSNVQASHGLNNTIREIEEKLDLIRKAELLKWLEDRPYFYEVNEGGQTYVAVHAYFDDVLYDVVHDNPEKLQSRKTFDWFKSCCIYGLTNKEGRISFWEGNHIETHISKFHLVSGHYHMTIQKPGFTMIDTSERAIMYFVPSLKYVGGVVDVIRSAKEGTDSGDEG